jgi:hypothetical protein
MLRAGIKVAEPTGPATASSKFFLSPRFRHSPTPRPAKPTLTPLQTHLAQPKALLQPLLRPHRLILFHHMPSLARTPSSVLQLAARSLLLSWASLRVCVSVIGGAGAQRRPSLLEIPHTMLLGREDGKQWSTISPPTSRSDLEYRSQRVWSLVKAGM